MSSPDPPSLSEERPSSPRLASPCSPSIGPPADAPPQDETAAGAVAVRAEPPPPPPGPEATRVGMISPLMTSSMAISSESIRVDMVVTGRRASERGAQGEEKRRGGEGGVSHGKEVVVEVPE